MSPARRKLLGYAMLGQAFQDNLQKEDPKLAVKVECAMTEVVVQSLHELNMEQLNDDSGKGGE